MEQNELAFKIAKKAFEGKKDKGGRPYLDHLVRVANNFQDDSFLYSIAILHDLIEDCPEWNIKSLRCLFNENIVKTIDLLTKKKNQTYEEYISLINESSWATKIKLADLKDNLDVSRLESVSEKDIERLNKYINAFNLLSL